MVCSILRIAPEQWKVRVLDYLLGCHSREDTIGGACWVPGSNLSGGDSFVKAGQGRIRATYAIEVSPEDAVLVLGSSLGLKIKVG